MERRRGWFKQPFGRRLRKLHAWNAWVILLLTVSGIILYVPTIRGDLGIVRVWLKQAHIVLGLLSVVLLAMYIPMIRRHAGQLRGRLVQQSNLAVVLVFLLGWSVSGIILWQFRHLPTTWSNSALVAHDLFTWLGVPYAVYHSISRSSWLRREAVSGVKRRAAVDAQSEEKAATPAAASDSVGGPMPNAKAAPIRTSKSSYREFDRPWFMSRRAFLRTAIVAAMAAIVGPSFYRWLKQAGDTGGGALTAIAETDGNQMLPLPTPKPESLQPLGGGAAGNFRIYTVTAFPEFTAGNWSFTIKGLVDQPITLSWEKFLELPRKVQVSDFHCVTGWSVYHCTWEGIPLSQLLDSVGVKPTAKFVKFYSGDGEYTDCLSLEQARMEDVMVAVMLDGNLIPQKLGGPVRLIVPKMYAYKSVKWLNGIELIDKDHRGYWEVRGYDNDAWVGRSNL